MGQNHSRLVARFEQNLVAYKESLETVQHLQQRALETAELVRRQGRRRVVRLRRLLILVRMDEGRLPDTMPSVVSGQPGFGGECDACSGYMPATQVMMMIPNGDFFAYVHADCYLIWAAQCRLRAALRRIA